MVFKKGDSKPKGSGKSKGVKNKKTIEFMEAVNNLMDMASPNMVRWLEQVAAVDPDKALKHIHSFAQFGYPLLARQDVNQRFVNKGGEDLAAEDLKIINDYKNKVKGEPK